ncbi:MAG: hypothetical protein MN733_10030, partial [Nitrososphaera sp.]|nr:hypothetical protein [Nitrososphaera sp.]
ILSLIEGGEWRAFWETLPKEIQKDFDDIYATVRTMVWDVEREADEVWLKIENVSADVIMGKKTRRDFALAVNLHAPPEFKAMMFSRHDGYSYRHLVFGVVRSRLKDDDKPAEE